MTYRFLAFAVLSCLCPTALVFAASYYVDPNGNDLNPGTVLQPWKTVARVNVGPLVRGDTVYFARGGVWRETLAVPAAGNSSNRITFDAFGSGANPVISGAEVVTGWTAYGAGTPNTYSAPLAASTVMVTANSAYLKKGASSTTLAPNQYFWAAGTLYINIGANPAGAVIEAGQRDHAVTTVSGRHYITLRNLRLEKTNIGNLLIMQSNFWRVEDCELFFGNSTGGKTGAGVHADRAHDAVFTRLHINYALGDGLMLWRSARVEVSHCNIHNVLDEGGDDGADGIQIGAPSTSPNACDGFKVLNNYVERPSAFVVKGGIITARGDNGIISGNVVVGGRFGLSSNGNNNIIEYNRVSSFGDNGGIRVSIGVPLNGTKIRYNVVTNNGNPAEMDEAGICLLHDSNENKGIPAPRTNFSIENNVVYNTYYGIAISQEFSGTVRNNIVWNDLPTTTNRRLTVLKFSTTGTTVIDNNIWQQRGTNPMFRIGNSQPSDGPDYNYPDLASWQAATPYDDHSTSASPQWVDPANYDFHLTEGSPAIDSGAGIGVAADFEGTPVPQGGAPDMGAFEFTGIRVYEGFEYAVGTVNGANGGTGWSGPWVAGGGSGLNHVIAGGFSYFGLPVVGNRLQLCDTDNVYQQVTRPLSKTFGATSGTYWISFLAKKNYSLREAYIDFGGLGFRANLGNPWEVKTPGTSYTTLNATFAELHFFLVKVDAAGSSTTVRVWVDPVIAAGEPHPASALVTLTDPAGFSFNTVSIRHGLGGNSKQSGEWDEIRLGSSFGAVTTAP